MSWNKIWKVTINKSQEKYDYNNYNSDMCDNYDN